MFLLTYHIPLRARDKRNFTNMQPKSFAEYLHNRKAVERLKLEDLVAIGVVDR